MRIILDEDLVVGVVSGQTAEGVGIDLPETLKHVPPQRLRYNGKEVIDIEQVTSFFVDELGQLHILPKDGLQPITCNWDSKLIKNGKIWEVEGPEVILQRAKDRASTEIDRQAEILRSKVLTGGEFQALAYAAQREEALKVKANKSLSKEETPYLNALVGVIGKDRSEVAENIIKSSDKSRKLDAAINAVRLKFKIAVDEATDAESIEKLLSDLTWPEV